MNLVKALVGPLLLGSALVLGGCIDCFDGGELEAAYRDGEAQAEQRNEAEFARGRYQASLLTYDDGLADGHADGHADGYSDGYYGLLGYPSGYELGYAEGHGHG